MSAQYRAPVLLERDHDITGFRSSSPEQTAWLHDFARGSHAGDHTKVHVVTEADSRAVVAYFAWRMAQLSVVDATRRATAGGGRYPVPVALLARLAVDERHEGRRLGSSILRHVMKRTAEAAQTIGCRALLVHCETSEAREWYLHHVPALKPSPSDPMHLILLTKDLRRAVSG
jgi:GNAT superfamily N-acetyltransferase